MKKKTAFIALTMFALLLSGCSKNKKNSSQNPSEDSGITQAVIGPSGGEVKDSKGNLSLNIPAGALDKETTISIKYVADEKVASEKLSFNFLACAEFGPSGTTFNVPVEATIKMPKTPRNTSLSVFCYDEKNDVWDYVTNATVDGANAKFSITHFSKYECLDITPEMLDKYVDLVYQAQAEGKPDEWITETYKNYLINEKRVFDYYEFYDDFWYEPCGLFISGLYKMNNKEGDPNKLINMIGESNLHGNKYGLSKIASEISSYEAATIAAGKTTSEIKEIVDVLVTLDYEMIKPDIDLTVNKSTLRNNESVTVNIFCHYINLRNQLYPDLILTGYPLSISQPSKFLVDRTLVTTNEQGKASFIATAKGTSGSETIKAVFNVGGTHGAYSEGTITLNIDASDFVISGYISEMIEFSYCINTSGMGNVVVDQNGSFRYVVNYNYSGTIGDSGSGLSGTLTISNAQASLTASPCRAHFTTGSYDILYDLFGNSINNVAQGPSYDVTGTMDDSTCQIRGSGGNKLVMTSSGSGTAGSSLMSETYTYDITVKINAEAVLNSFLLQEGTKQSQSSTFKDVFDVRFVDEYGDESGLDDWNMIISNRSEQTVQSITIA